MRGLAKAVHFDDVQDEGPAARAVKDCFDCDEDNPRRVERRFCQTCKGTGEQEFAAAEIARELRASKKEPVKEFVRGKYGRKKTVVEEDDQNLEY